ncbi:MAG: flavin reductase family protein [Acidimicrobiales bacterium]|nr:flavin reductase family protein [Acidimicrobiales bacterium]
MADEMINEIDSNLYRKVLGRYPTGVTLVTAMEADEPVAMVIGSFVSVSMDPPLVAFLPGKESYTWGRMASAGGFCVNVLSDKQTDLSNAFFRKGDDPWVDTIWHAAKVSGSPVIPSCLASIDCMVHSVVDAGDHWFVMGRVVEVSHVDEGSPLVFLGGNYGEFRKQD